MTITPSEPSPYELLFGSNTRFKIWVQLNLNSRLNLSQIARILNKSKSTIHEHLQKLLNAEILQEVEEKGVEYRIPAKFYSLSPNWWEIVAKSPEIDHLSDQLDVQKAIKNITLKKAMTRMFQNMLEIKMDFLDLLERKLQSQDPEIQQKYLEIFNDTRYSDEKQENFGQETAEIVDIFDFHHFDQYFQLMYDLVYTDQKYSQEKKSRQEKLLTQYSNEEKDEKRFREGFANPYFYLVQGIPIKKILDILQNQDD